MGPPAAEKQEGPDVWEPWAPGDPSLFRRVCLAGAGDTGLQSTAAASLTSGSLAHGAPCFAVWESRTQTCRKHEGVANPRVDGSGVQGQPGPWLGDA